jgi:hypothetical protein
MSVVFIHIEDVSGQRAWLLKTVGAVMGKILQDLVDFTPAGASPARIRWALGSLGANRFGIEVLHIFSS